jgi:nitrogen regulatory protein PII
MNMLECGIKLNLIVTIVNRGFSEDVVYASKKAGAEGGTVISGRGSGIHENTKIMGIPIEPEKDIVLTLIPREKTDGVLHAISDTAGLDKPGNGIAFVIEVEKAAGICHLMNNFCNTV